MAFSFDSSGPADVLFMVDIIRIFSFYCIKKDLTCIYGPIKYLIARRGFAFLRNAERHIQVSLTWYFEIFGRSRGAPGPPVVGHTVR